METFSTEVLKWSTSPIGLPVHLRQFIIILETYCNSASVCKRLASTQTDRQEEKRKLAQRHAVACWEYEAGVGGSRGAGGPFSFSRRFYEPDLCRKIKNKRQEGAPKAA